MTSEGPTLFTPWATALWWADLNVLNLDSMNVEATVKELQILNIPH